MTHDEQLVRTALDAAIEEADKRLIYLGDAVSGLDPSAIAASVPVEKQEPVACVSNLEHRIFSVLYEMRLAPRHQLKQAAAAVIAVLPAAPPSDERGEEIAKLRAELEQARKDSARLDALQHLMEKDTDPFYLPAGEKNPAGIAIYQGEKITLFTTVREAIDAAIE